MKLQGSPNPIAAPDTAPTEELTRAVATAVTDVVLQRMSVMRGEHSRSLEGSLVNDSKMAAMGSVRPSSDAIQIIVVSTSPTPIGQHLGPHSVGPRYALSGSEQQAVLDALARIGLHGLSGPSLRQTGDNNLSPGAYPSPGSHAHGGAWHRGDDRQSHHYPKAQSHRAHDPQVREETPREQPRLKTDGAEPRKEDIARVIVQQLPAIPGEPAPQREAPTIVDKADTHRPLNGVERGAHPEEKTIELKREPISPQQAERVSQPTPEVRAIINDPRNDAARLIQQIITNELTNKPPQNQDIINNPIQPTPTPLPLLHTRDSISAHADQLRDILQTITERSTPRPTHDTEPRASAQATSVGTVGDFSRTEPVSRSIAPSNDLQREGRTPPSPGTVVDPSLVRGDAVTSDHRELLQRALAPDGQPKGDLTNPLQAQVEHGRSLLNAITSAAEKILNIEALRKLDAALETVVISAAAGVTLGVIGVELVSQEILKVALGLLDILKGEKTEDPSVEKAIQELKNLCHDGEVESTAAPAEMVADITGEITLAGSGSPVEGIIVDGGSLGLAITDISGHFRFSNVPLDSGYALLIQDSGYSFSPSSIVGTVSTTNHHVSSATKT